MDSAMQRSLSRRPARLLALLATAAAFTAAGTRPEAQEQEPAAGPNAVFPHADRAAVVTVGPRGELRVDGRPFLPIFMWRQPPAKLDFVRSLGINTVMAEGPGRDGPRELLDALHARKMWGIVHMKPRSRALKSHPSLLTWMFTDEPDLPARLPAQEANQTARPPGAAPLPPRVAPEEIARQYAAAKEADPTHPIYLNLTAGFFRPFARHEEEAYRAYCRATDLVGYDLYPVTLYGRPEWVPLIAPATRRLRELAPARVPVWAILECTQKLEFVSQERLEQIGRPQGATPVEVRAMVWMALIAGARGIGYFPHRWDPYDPAGISEPVQAELKRTNAQLGDLAPAILGPDDAGRITLTPADGGPVEFVTRRSQDGSAAYLFMVNASTAPARVRMRVTGARTLRDLDTGEEVPVGSQPAELTFPALQVRLFSLQMK